jgi:hypothetical protein
MSNERLLNASAERMRFAGTALLSTFLLAGCGDSLGVDGPGNVSVAFRASEAPSAAAAPQAGASAPSRITYEGANGTLVLEQVLMIVSEVELDLEDDCDDDARDDDAFDDCEDFETGPQLVDLALDGAPIPVLSGLVPPGVYDELEFEIEDLDDDDADRRVALDELREEIVALVADWPRNASLYVTGTFQPTDGDPVPFRTFIDAEIEIELELSPELVIGDDGSASRELVVDVRPDLWLLDSQGNVMDMREWDYDTTGRILELEIDIEDGFIEVEFDH